ncbi:hypothetical protein FBQ97_22400, partial [Acidobacteria bacterium ACD]|nr:hypothetical protein [Acidobacteria bacterium ACD]
MTPARTLPLSVLALHAPQAAPADAQRLVPNREDEGPVPEGPPRPTQGAYVDQKEPGKGDAPGLGTIGFQGLSAAGVAPPDSDGSVGPNHYVQWINSRIAVFDKATGVMAPGFPIAGNVLFTSLGGVCASHNDGDPIVLYDSLADRWQISQFAVGATEDPAANSHQCVAVSAGPDPTGSWYVYDFPSVFGSPDDFIDYPKLSTWTDAYYMTGKSFCSSGTYCTTGLYGVLYAFERAQMLVGLPARMVAYANPAVVGGTSAPNILTTDVDGLTPPPPGRPAHAFWQRTTTSLGVVSLATTWGATPAMTVTPLPDIPITATTSVSCTSNGQANRRCVPQPTPAADPADQLDALSSRLMFRAPYRNLGATESVVLNHTIAGTSPVKAAVRWYEIRLETGTPTLFQSGTFAPDNTNRFMGSIAMDASGNIALGYSRSARAAAGPPVVPAVIPEVSVAGRLAGDPPGTMTGDTVLKAGVGVQTGTGNRWGDYSTMNVDP